MYATRWQDSLPTTATFLVNRRRFRRERETKHYPVRQTPNRRLRQVDFVFEGNKIPGLAQNPVTKSRWAQIALSGKKVMQFLNEDRYVRNVINGEVTLHSKK
jgi:hypothetical protein